jgi:hypothetical protein
MLRGKLAERDESTVPIRLTECVLGLEDQQSVKVPRFTESPTTGTTAPLSGWDSDHRRDRANHYDKSRGAASFPRNSVYRIYLGGFRKPSRLLDIDRLTYRRIGLLRGVVSLKLSSMTFLCEFKKFRKTGVSGMSLVPLNRHLLYSFRRIDLA